MTQMKAVVKKDNGQDVLVDVEKPTPKAGEILVKVQAIALNPTDWKGRDMMAPKGARIGCDFAGTVEEAVETSKIKVGDRVAGFVRGGQEGQGSFAEYITTEAALVWKVPVSLDWEQAAALGGIGPHTAVQALYMRHKLPWPSSPLKEPIPFLVWGGSSSVGLYAVQLAKASGLTVIATCSPKNFEIVQDYGAAALYDYSDPETPAKIKADYPTLSKALDTISEKGTTAKVAHSLGDKGGKIITLLGVKPEDQGGVPNVEVEVTMVYTVLGKSFKFGPMEVPASPEDRSAIEKWLDYVPSLIESGALNANPLWHIDGGLEKVHEGLELLKAGKPSAQKITLKL